ncbi:MAG: FGGY-family carbohydrate kinase [Ktedonobacteraceae bacterium]|nr:FGGY-family carbohydrate kinase [Ktedonobacteraceae bacterium]
MPVKIDNYVIGVDMGTQGVRCLAVTADGTVLARAALSLPAESLALATGTDGVSEQNAEDWWNITFNALGQLAADLAVAGIPPEAGSALCISGTSGTFVPLDAAHRPLRPAIMYSDGRATEEAARCNAALVTLCEEAGYRFNTSFALPRLLWLARHETATIARTALIAHQADYLAGQLTGIWGISDYHNVLKTGYDLLAERYPPEIASELHLSPALFPRVVAPATPIGSLRADLAKALKLNPHLLVVAGTTDGCASQFAAGASAPGEWVSSLGTTLTIKGVSNTLIKDPQGRVYCHRHPEQGWLPGGASNSGGEILLRRFAGADLAAYDNRTASLAPTSLLCYPLVRHGERFPFVAPDAEGFLLDPQDQARGQLDLSYVAALEGVALLERLAYEVVSNLGAPLHGPIRTVGGAARSRLWLRIRASVCNRPFVVPAIADPAMGAAMLAASGRCHASLQSAIHSMVHHTIEIEPEAQWTAIYEERYAWFKEELQKRRYLSTRNNRD